MSDNYDYVIRKDVKFGFLKLIDVAKIRDGVVDDWFNQTLCQVNDCVVRIGVLEGEFHWHKHDREDEFFFVLSGKLLIDLEGATVELGPHQGYTVGRGVVHRTRAPEKTVMLMVERSGIVPTGDEGT